MFPMDDTILNQLMHLATQQANPASMRAAMNAIHFLNMSEPFLTAYGRFVGDVIQLTNGALRLIWSDKYADCCVDFHGQTERYCVSLLFWNTAKASIVWETSDRLEVLMAISAAYFKIGGVYDGLVMQREL